MATPSNGFPAVNPPSTASPPTISVFCPNAAFNLQEPPKYFNTSSLHSLDVINTLLSHHPRQATAARKPLLAAKVYLEQGSITRDATPTAVLELCETRLEWVACLLADGEAVVAESEALQVTAACKKLFKPVQAARGTGEWETAVRCLRTHVRALEVLQGIDEQRGVVARAKRWREARERLEGKLEALEG